jgi:uncharacterized protein DUF4238
MIGSHIIPAFYLEQFSMPSELRKRRGGKVKPGRVWVYEKGEEPKLRSTSRQGRENGYFGFILPDGRLNEAFESELAKREGECNEVLVCARSGLFHWPSGSQEKIAFYAALLHSRATQARDFNARNLTAAFNLMKEAATDESLIQEIADKLGLDSPNGIRKGIEQWSKTPPDQVAARNTFVSNLTYNSELKGQMLLKKTPWRVLRPPQGKEFITSDNPLVTFLPLQNGKLHPGYGFNFKGSVSAFALAPDACLSMGPWSVANTLTEAAHSELQETVISICDRYVYSKTRADSVKTLVAHHAGEFRYGINALIPTGGLPDARQLLRRHFGL